MIVESKGNPEDIIASIKAEKDFKNLLVTTGNDKSLLVEKLSFGIDALDELLDGGLPYGRITLAFGDSSVGKTFMVQKLIASALKQNKTVAYVDIAKTYHPGWMRYTGVDIEKLVVARPMYGEQAFKLGIKLVEAGIDLLIMDDLDGIVPISEEEIMSDTTQERMTGMASQARVITIGVRNLLRVNQKSVIVLVNHVKESIGPYGGHYIPGGKAQRDMSSVILWVVRGSLIKENEVVEGGSDKVKAGFKMRVTLEKDKVTGKQFEFCEIPFLFKDGAIDNIYTLIEVGIDLNIITHSGPSYNVLGTKLFGKIRLREYLKSHEDVCKELRSKIAEVKTMSPKTANSESNETREDD